MLKYHTQSFEKISISIFHSNATPSIQIKFLNYIFFNLLSWVNDHSNNECNLEIFFAT